MACEGTILVVIYSKNDQLIFRMGEGAIILQSNQVSLITSLQGIALVSD
jgi:hypothetical protein